MYDKLEYYLSEARLRPYLELANNDKEKAVELYKLNIEVSKNFYALLSYLEIFLRNKIDILLTKDISENWIDKIQWRNKHLEQIEEVKNKIKRKKKIYNKHDIIGNLRFGFWVHLFDNNYQSSLWYTSLNKIFSFRTNRKYISRILKDVLEFRNRISHYEIIIKNDLLERNKNNISFLIKEIDKELYSWLISNNYL